MAGRGDASSAKHTPSPSDSAGDSSTASDSGGGVTSWKERCLILEDSLNRFRQQASKIRNALGQKMSDLEDKLHASEKRAEIAEQQANLMEQQLAAMDWKPGELENRCHELQILLQERDATVRELEVQLEEQRIHRQVDARQVEEKAQRIKDWVTCKLQELESQNSLLVRENAELQAQVLILRQRLLSLPATAAKEIYRLSIQDGTKLRPLSQGSTDEPPELPERNVHSTTTTPFGTAVVVDTSPHHEDMPSDHRHHHQHPHHHHHAHHRRPHQHQHHPHPDHDQDKDQEDANSNSLSPDNTDNLVDGVSDVESEESIGAEMDQDLYQEIDANHESIYELKTAPGPPQIRIDRKLFHGRLLDSLISSSNGSEEMLDRTARLSASQGAGAPENGHFGGLEDGEFIIAEDITPINLTPKSANASFSFQSAAGASSAAAAGAAPPSTPTNVIDMNFNPTSVTAATLPRVKDKGKPAAPVKLVKSDNIDAAVLLRRPLLSGVEIQVHQYGSEPHDIGTPEKVGVKFCSDDSLREGAKEKGSREEEGGGNVSVSIVDGTTTGSEIKSPASEKRAYAVAHKRSKAWKKTREHHTTSSALPLVIQQPGIGHLFEEISAPVYATLKGKAAQIRNTPFMEESSSDSSEDEEEVVVTESVTASDSNKGPSESGTHRPVSDSSCDYALPPEDVSSKSDSDTSEPEQKLLKFAADSQKHDTLEKCGYLSQLSGKVKTWRRRFFVLRNGELYFYKSQHDVFKKPQGSIVLDSQTKITKSTTELSFEIINCKKTYYLTADSPAELERWIRVLQRVLRQRATGNLLESVDSKAVVKGWVTKVKNGVTRRCWCVLLGRHFLYFKSPGDKTPIGQLNLQDAKLEEIEGACDSDDESDVVSSSVHVFAIWPPCQAPTYLVIPTKQEKDSWLYHLTVATGGGTGTVGTDYEQFIAKLMQVNADANSGLWKHPLMLYTKEPLREPLTTLPSVDLQCKAVELFKMLYQFMNTAIESPAVEFHVRLAQNLLAQCLEHPELQNELYCQLIKQTSRHPSQPKTAVQSLLLCGKHSWFLCDGSPTSPTSSVVDLTDCKLNPTPHALLQGWQLLSLAVSLFMPKQSVTWLIKVHLHRHADPKSEIGKYAIYCQRALERTVVKGARESPPSRMEVMSMLLRHPYHHSQPISIPIHFLNDSYQVVSFDGSTTVLEFIQSLNKMIGVRDTAQSGFALFADDPTGLEVEHCLEGHLKVCDVISKWEQALSRHHCSDGSDDSSRTIRLVYKNRLYFKNSSRQETEKEKLLLAYQVNEEIVHGRFPLNRDLALELTSLMAQVEYGDLRSSDAGTSLHPGSSATPPSQSPGSAAAAAATAPHSPATALGPQQQVLGAALERFYPARFLDKSQQDSYRQLVEGLYERWRSLRGRSVADCVRVYLAVARKWQFFGATLYRAKVKGEESKEEADVWLAVQEDGVSVLDHTSMQPISLYDYKSIMTFGGWRDDFMIVVTQLIESAPHHYEIRTEKFLFSLFKPKIHEITLQIASYINVKLQQSSPEGAPGE